MASMLEQRKKETKLCAMDNRYYLSVILMI
jgi:hypothetical protein